MKIFFLINVKRRDQGPPEELLREFRRRLDASGHDYEIFLSDDMDATSDALNRAVADGFDALWIGGGDGTLNYALNCTFGKGMAYGIVPMGTINALARALRLPLDPLQSVDYLLKAQPIAMDVGHVADKYFFTYATVGLHAAVFQNVDSSLKRRWGSLAFWESAVRTVYQKSRLPRFIMEMELADAPPGEHIVRDYGYSFTLSNVANYVGWSTVTRENAASPGYFELHHFRKNRLMPMVIWFTLLRTVGVEKSRPQSGQIFRLIRWVKVRSHRNLSLQVDGEPIRPADRKHLEFRCLQDAVHILLQEPEAVQLSQPTGGR